MTNNDEFDFFMDESLTRAVKEFKLTQESSLFQKRLEQMDRDCETMLMKDQREFAVECFELIMEVNQQEEIYVYRKAFKDCINVLKALGVLA